MIQTKHTPGCDGTETPAFRVCDVNRRIGTETFTYLRCATCGLIRLETPPPNLSGYYPSAYYTLPSRERLARIANRDPGKLDTVMAFARGGRLLEVGPAQGIFAFQASRAGFEVDTIEMDARCCDYLREVVGVRAIQSDEPDVTMRGLAPYAVIALWHVIEHLPDPWAFLEVAAERCLRGGIIVIAAPNPEAWQFSLMGREWPHLDAPRHLHLIPRALLKDRLTALGFSVVHDTTRDGDARMWNRFGWQRLLMNRVSGRQLERVAFLLGYALSFVTAPFERRNPRGSTYTLVFQKTK